MSTATAALLKPATATLEDSYRHCRQIARARAKNFYYSFLVLPKPQRDAMCAIYAFMRQCDDLSDDPAAADKSKLAESIAQWRVDTDWALRGDVAGNPIWPAFHDTVKRYGIPHRFFYEMIDGIASDLEPRQMSTFDELYDYCYHVASVVGLTIIHIWGFRSPKALLFAEKCGVAFQLTNILRDVREDAQLGRVYLPLADLDRFGVTVEQLQFGKENEGFVKLMEFEAERARAYYNESAPLAGLISRDSRACLWALRKIYMGLLSRLEQANFAVLSRRINVPTRTKLGILLWAMLTRK
ncbi:MAG: phytoene/squalene synthase family protein [Acidobacteriaceae bacterium]|nr:phytoene/squalene synthase family protein [Acidobacteriaceae bacterium]